jgi:NAD(P)-dependent dehydrogenase (short-subunit alcohol dehydrogenase family)
MAKNRYIGKVALGLGAIAGVAAAVASRSRRYDLSNKTVFITGGSRGLGLLLAQQYAARGANVAISARDRDVLDRAAERLRQSGAKIIAVEGDVTVREEAELAIEQVRKNLGPVDVLVNNAGTICVGPMETMTIDDYRDSINTHFWGPYFATMAVLPEMQKRRAGRIVNISSIGGKISVPHLLPYSVGKFALTGFSEGLRSEALKDNVYITTVCPGLMRTGSPRNAHFRGDNAAEYAWFSISDSLPLLSMSAGWAARRIVNASIRGDAELVLSLPAKLAVQLHGLFPGLTSDALGLANKMLPTAPDNAAHNNKEWKTGRESFSKLSPSWITSLNERAATNNNQLS